MATNVQSLKNIDLLSGNAIKKKVKNKQSNDLIADPFAMMLGNGQDPFELSTLEIADQKQKKHKLADKTDLANILSLAVHRGPLPNPSSKQSKSKEEAKDLLNLDQASKEKSIILASSKEVMQERFKNDSLKDSSEIKITFTEAKVGQDVLIKDSVKLENIMVINDNRGAEEVSFEIDALDNKAIIESNIEPNSPSSIAVHSHSLSSKNINNDSLNALENSEKNLPNGENAIDKNSVEITRIDSYKPILVAKPSETSPGMLKIELYPASLGKVDIELSVANDGTIDAVVKTENAEAFYLLSQNQQELKQVIAESFKQESLGEFELSMGMEHNQDSQNNDSNGANQSTKDHESASLLSLNEVEDVVISDLSQDQDNVEVNSIDLLA